MRVRISKSDKSKRREGGQELEDDEEKEEIGNEMEEGEAEEEGESVVEERRESDELEDSDGILRGEERSIGEGGSEERKGKSIISTQRFRIARLISPY